MAHLTAPRNTQRRDGDVRSFPTGQTVWQGSLAAITADGKAVPASADPALICLGRADATTRPGENATISCGTFLWANAGDVTIAHIGKPAYAVDDQTVSADPGGDPATRPVAGRVFDVTPAGVWVAI